MIIVRPAELSDLENIVHTHSMSAMKTYDSFLSPATIQATFTPDNLRRNWLKSFAEHKSNPNNRLLLVAEDSQHPEWGILGVARCHIITKADERAFFDAVMGPEKTAEKLSEIQTLYVHPAYQHHGVGRVLIGEMARFLAERGNQKSVVVTLDGYDTSARFYQRVGGARLVGQFNQNTAETAGAANADADVSKFNLWMFDNVSCCISGETGIKWICHHNGKYGAENTNQGNERTA